jgi:hypothetical protein
LKAAQKHATLPRVRGREQKSNGRAVLVQRSLVLLALVVVAAVAAASASASNIIGRNVSRPTLAIDSHGHAHISYVQGGRKKTVSAWGAINARKPSRTVPQVKFKIRYGQGGKGVCRPYDGPALDWLVKACKAPDGSYWALQAWRRLTPNYGGKTGPLELHLSHWRGALAQLVIYQDWTPAHYRHIFGRLTYDGVGAFGYTATGPGSPLDGYGRNIYVDTFDSGYGTGWHRESSFLTHHLGDTPGDFCYAFHQSGDGAKYRATVIGPGVTPDVMWQADDIGAFDQSVEDQMLDLERSWGDPKCRS